MAYTKYPLSPLAGLNKDLLPEDLDPNTFSEIHNLRMTHGRLVPVQGYEEVFSPPPVAPVHVLGVVQQSTPTVFVAGENAIHKNANGLWSNVSRTVGGAYTSNEWQSTVLNSCIFMNNGVDKLQVLEAADTTFKDSVNVPTSFRAEVFRGFKNYLFALNINEGVSQIPNALRWSDPADPGTEPPSWDITDPTTQAGQTVLADTDGDIIDAMQLRDSLIIYKTDSVYSCQFIGGIFVFSFQKIISDKGCLSRDCIASFEGTHFVVGFDDIYVHDGLQANSISDNRIKDFFYKDLNQAYLENVFCSTNNKDKEIWICYPDDQSATGACNKALVWNWVDNIWSTRDLPNILSTSMAIVDPKIDDLWDAGKNDTWDLGGLHWDANNFSPANRELLMASSDDDKLYQVNNTAEFNGATFDYTLEKLSHAFGEEDVVKHLNHLTPDIGGQGVMSVRFGTQNHLGEGVSWKPITQYTVGRFRMHTRGSGRYFSVRVEGNTATSVPSIGKLDAYLTIEGGK